MTGRERVRAMMRGETTDHLPFMPITMMFAADRAGLAIGATRATGRCWQKRNCASRRSLASTT